MNIKVFYHRFKIRDQIFTITLLLLVIFGFLGLVTFNYFSKMYEKEIYKESADKLQISSAVLDKELNKIEKLSFNISTDSFVQNSLIQIRDSLLQYEAYRTKARLIDALVTYATQERYISSIQIMDTFGSKYTAGYNTKIKVGAEDILPQALEVQGANIWTVSEVKNRLTSARVIRGKENLNLEYLGTLFITIDMNILIRETLDIPINNNFVISRGDEIVYMSRLNELEFESVPAAVNESGFETKRIDGKDYLVTFLDSQFSDLTYYHFLPFDDITKQSAIIKQTMIICFIFLLILTIYLSRGAASVLSKPIEELTGKMKQVQRGKFEKLELKEEVYLDNEVGQLHKNFQTMINEMDVLIQENYKKQLMIQETEYKALQAQINPHFLYNTLDSINWMAKVNQQPKISIMAEALGNMMRNIISKKAPLISIADELLIVENYVTIQKYRYNDRLTFTLESLSENESYLIPKLSIQPIVENTIQHGVEESIFGCDILVKIHALDEKLRIVVEDNGPGMDEHTVKSIFAGEVKRKGTGIGLRNINDRIKLMFGSAYGLQIESEVGKGTRVTITLPCRMG